ncbi:MAG TPA: aminoglycoside phosphotransferase family protein [Gaiellaceae bacterium]|nr:aminoglycoside phosphotransferase family protein [Gaiellaceae bacterium]
MAVDLTETRAAAEAAARTWGLGLAEPFGLSRHSYVAAAGTDAVVKAAWEGDDESLHEPDALALWDGDGAVRLLARAGRVLLLERARPGTDISDLGQDAAMAVAVEVGRRLWRPADAPFRPVAEHVPRWLANNPSPLTPLAREIWSSFDPGAGWVVHGDFHHHNVLRHGDGYAAIDPKPYLADREYDVYAWLHNPVPYRMTRTDAERRIARFVAAGLDDRRIRMWAIVRGAYLASAHDQDVLRSLLD